ncbi:hypothetical protein LRS71_11800 [Rhodococcus pyridinivorans]|uniref:hypothetical protein n=1 Tax=Rhodococcus pyridinivorans TaxID=103816 RepID=UPI001E573AF9|nr:hypothetical protein [Rhodococcus pyridinivorans]MCD5420235.1 hypothetical protein [Rhodococcus pyridinivorans]
MTWIGWPLLGWLRASPVIDLSERRALRLGEHHWPEQDGNGPATLPEPRLPM